MANLSNINNILRVSSSGVGLNKNNTGPSELDIESSGADMIDMTRTGQKTYRFAISGASAFSLFDVAANADRLIIDSSGNVGIGTDSPAHKLQVNGNSTVNPGNKFGWVYNPGVDNNMYNYIQTSITTGQSYAAEPLEISGARWTSGNTRSVIFTHQTGGEIMTIMTGGNVGIGVTVPVTKLEVSGSTTNSSVKAGTLEMQSYSVNNAWLADNVYYNGAWYLRSTGYASQVYFGSGGDISFKRFATGNAGTVATPVLTMQLDSAGNVGIGKSQSGNAVLTARSSAGGNTGIILIEGDTTDDGWGVYATTANKYIITRFTAGSYSDKFTILEGGNVGIGTTSPIVKQHNVITSNGTALLLNNSSGGSGAYVDLDFNTYSVTQAGFANAAASIRVIDDGAFSGNITFRTKGASIGASQTERMRILSTGAISVGSSGTAYGTAGQVLTSNGNASPSWQAAGGSAWPQEKFAEYTIDSTTSNILVATMNSTTWHGNYLAGCLKFTMSTGDYIQVTYVPVSTFLSGSNKWFFKGTEMTSKNNGSNSALLVFTFAGDQGTFGSTCTLKINRSFNVSNYTKVNVLVQAISNPNMFILN